MIILGLTGSIGMGKTTVAGFFAEAGIPVFDADKTAHDLYLEPEIIAEISQLFPCAVVHNTIDRQKLAIALFDHKTRDEQKIAVAKLEDVIHPYVRARENDFILKAHQDGKFLVVLDIPLLYETMAKEAAKTGQEAQNSADKLSKRVDYIAVVTAPFEVQKQRVLARPNMTEEKFTKIIEQQISDENKRAKADFIIDTAQDLATTRQQVANLIDCLHQKSQSER